MTGLEILLFIALYIIVGLWVCYKRDWYDASADTNGDQILICTIATIGMPLNLIIVFFSEFLIRKW